MVAEVDDAVEEEGEEEEDVDEEEEEEEAPDGGAATGMATASVAEVGEAAPGACAIAVACLYSVAKACAAFVACVVTLLRKELNMTEEEEEE